MEQLTLGQAAEKYAPNLGGLLAARSSQRQLDFKAGAEWQKEQYNGLITLMRQLLSAYTLRLPDTKQLLAGYTNEQAFDKLNKMLELIQD